jgi:hypothetical protein
MDYPNYTGCSAIYSFLSCVLGFCLNRVISVCVVMHNNIKMIYKLSGLFILLTSLVATSMGQTKTALAIPNDFHGFVLGTPLLAFEAEHKDLGMHRFSIPYSDITTRNMAVYTLKGQLTEAGDKIDIDFFFYDSLLAVMRVVYKEPQSNDLFEKALTAKFGDGYRSDNKIYPNLPPGTSIANLYWENSTCCILSFSSSDPVFGQVYLIFAEKAVQVKLKEQELKNTEKKID